MIYFRKYVISFLMGSLCTLVLLNDYESIANYSNTLELQGQQGQQEQQKQLQNQNQTRYVPAESEQYIMDNLVSLGYAQDGVFPMTCGIWKNPDTTNKVFHEQITAYKEELEYYADIVNNFTAIPDLRKAIQRTNNHDVCKATRPHSEGLQEIFKSSSQLSYSSNTGYMEPLLPPMRHPKLCDWRHGNVLNLAYLVHDFEAMCHKLKPHSRLVMIDAGASLEFHGKDQPIMYLLNLYEKFGFHFDHIYAFEMKKFDPNTVYQKLLPEKYMQSYHWMNTGVNAEEGHKLNPLHSILKKFDEDDFIVLKLDIDTSSVELPLAKQLLDDKDDFYHRLLDQFYFEHHVEIGEMKPYWRGFMNGTIKDSFDLFHGLRKKGIAAHFWV